MTRGERVIKFIETYCFVPEGALVGRPIVLDKFQKDFILAIYDNPKVTYKGILSIARKNGKTGIIAGIALAHLVGPEAIENGEIASGAMSRDQASIVFKYASKMVNLNPKLKNIIKIIPSKKQLIGLPMNTTYTAMAADGATAQGGSPYLVILDEAGQIRGSQSDFVDALETSQGAYENPIMLVISTQAPTDADLLSIWIDDAKKNGDPHTVCHIYCADDDADVLDKNAWKAANPAMGSFRNSKDIEKLANKADRMPSFENSFRNLILNQRVSTISPFVSVNAWKSCGGEPRTLEGMTVYGGIDLSSKKDLTAFVLIARDEDGVVHVEPHFWTPGETIRERSKEDRVPYDVWAKQGYLRTTKGATVDYKDVARDILEIVSDYDIEMIAFDRWRIALLQKEFDELDVDFPLAEFGQGFKDMSPALDTAEADILNKRLRHGEHPVLNMCALNAVTDKDPAGNRKLVKNKSTGRIDGMVALVMALGAENGTPVQENIDDFLENIVIA